VPPFEPAHVQFHAPEPPTVEAVPAVQRLLVGALVRTAPFDEPHAPLTAEDVGAQHNPVAPPLLPVQLQVHGPLPLTADAWPALQRLALGAVLTATPFALPHVPTILSRAEQLAVVPPFEPAHVQFHGPEPPPVEAVPAVQRLLVGALVRSAPFDEPHAPLMAPPLAPDCACAEPTSKLVNDKAQADSAVTAIRIISPTSSGLRRPSKSLPSGVRQRLAL
jgi:hypothetical protein